MCKFETSPFGPQRLTRHDIMGIRYVTDPAGGDPGAGDPAGGDPAGGDALGDPGKQALDRMKAERNQARADAKAFADLGLTPDQIKELKAAKDKADADAGKVPDAATIEKNLRKQIETEQKDRTATKFRASAVREQAATLGFIDPKDALTSLDARELAAIDVDDDDEVDAAAVKKLLEALAKAKPYLLKPTDTTPDYRAAGVGSTSSGNKPDVQPGADRLRQAYAASK